MNGFLKLITGNLGGGKTSWAVEQIVEHLRGGGYAATNIEMKFDEVEKWLASQGYVFDASRLIILKGGLTEFYEQIPRGAPDCVVLTVIDEAAIVGFNSRDFAKLNRTVFNFCTLARKLDVGLFWITQRPQFFDKQLRELCCALIDCRDMRQFRIWGVIPLPIPLLVRMHHQMIDGRPVHPSAEVVVRKKWVWKLYNSDALLGDAASEFYKMRKVSASQLQRVPRAASGHIKYAVLVSLCASFFSSY